MRSGMMSPMQMTEAARSWRNTASLEDWFFSRSWSMVLAMELRKT